MNVPRRICPSLTIVLVLLMTACATQKALEPSASAAAPATAAAKSEPPAAKPAPPTKPVRKLPRMTFASNIDWYPSKAKQEHLTGRVLVQFKIDGQGKAVSMKVLKAEAPRSLRNAALNFVTDVTFDVTDPAYNVADPAPYAISVRFCIIDCGTLVGYPGYEDVRIAGSQITSPFG